MPFDGTDFDSRPERPNGTPPSDTLVTFIIVAVAVSLLVTPLTVAACADILRALRAG